MTDRLPSVVRFAPVYKNYLWGGDRIVRRFRPDLPAGIYAESWEISVRPEGMSVVECGPLKGATLSELVDRFGAAVLGTAVPSGKFPLLLKLIDARETLSVQVHPNDANAAATGGEPKSEMWYVLDADPGAELFLGFVPGVTPARLLDALRSDEVAPLLRRRAVRPGDAVYVPGGAVHAIGTGCLMLECQQSSNTTYRLYDWGRRGPDGQPRELHIEQALRSIDWTFEPCESPPRALPCESSCEAWELLNTPYFRACRYRLKGALRWPANPQSFRMLFVVKGGCRFRSDDASDETVPAGRSALIPACAGELEVSPLAQETEFITFDVPPSLEHRRR